MLKKLAVMLKLIVMFIGIKKSNSLLVTDDNDMRFDFSSIDYMSDRDTHYSLYKRYERYTLLHIYLYLNNPGSLFLSTKLPIHAVL